MRSLRAKLLVLLVAPVAVLVLLAGIGFRSSQHQVDRARDQLAVTEVASAVDTAVRVLVLERQAAVAPDGSDGAATSGHRQTDDVLDNLDRVLADHGGLLDGQEVEAARNAMDDVAEVRGDLDGDNSAAEIHTTYDRVIGPLGALGIDTSSVDPDTVRRLEAQRGLVEVTDQLIREDGLVLDAAASGVVDDDTYRAVAAAESALAVWDARVRQAAPARQADAYDQSLATTLGPTDERLPVQILDAGPGADLDATGNWPTEIDEALDHLGTLTDDGGEELDEIARDDLQAAARDRLMALGWLAAALLAAAVLLVLLWRLVLSPLGSTTSQARKAAVSIEGALATGDLRDVTTITPRKDVAELAELTRAVGRLQLISAALIKERAATPSAGSAVYLAFGKRAQSLVTRQLSQIDGLEARTEDPEVLSELFTLDHLTTRLRRTAESMVLLAGAESPRPWARPISTVNVIRAAMAETVDYSRINLAHVGPGAVTGAVANDVSHLLAELIDNGLAHAPPESRVTATGERHPDGRYVVGISNVGQGMPPDELSRANALLSGARPASGDAAPLPFSLHVAGRLAALHGIEVTLLAAPLGRIRAEVTLPRAIMVLPTDAEAPAALGPASPQPAPTHN